MATQTPRRFTADLGEQLRIFIRERKSGGCAWMSFGRDCGCELCAVDTLVHRASKAEALETFMAWLDKRVSRIEATFHDADLDENSKADEWAALLVEVNIIRDRLKELGLR